MFVVSVLYLSFLICICHFRFVFEVGTNRPPYLRVTSPKRNRMLPHLQKQTRLSSIQVDEQLSLEQKIKPNHFISRQDTTNGVHYLVRVPLHPRSLRMGGVG